VDHGGPTTWRLHTGVCKFAKNTSTNIRSLGKRRDLKLREVSSLLISYNITISWLNPLNSFWFIFSLRDRKTVYRVALYIHQVAVLTRWPYETGDREKGFYRKIIDKERVLSKVKAGVFFLTSYFFRFPLFPAIFALRRSGRKKLPMFRMQKAHNSTSPFYNKGMWLGARTFPLIVILTTVPSLKVHH